MITWLSYVDAGYSVTFPNRRNVWKEKEEQEQDRDLGAE